MLSDAELLSGVPEFLSIESMLKATPSQEGDARFIYMEASNEARDLQNERVLAKALEESADYYLRYGNTDLEHYTLIGKPNPRKGWAGIPNPELYEIGRPVAVRVAGTRTFVKSQIYSGEGPTVENANMFWASLTSQNPPARWYPSVGGVPLAKSVQVDKSSGERIAVVEKVRWTNIGMSRTPVNPDLPVAQTVPVGALAKSLTAGGFVIKGLEAGYGTDSATMAGGASLRKQSLDRTPKNYFDLRERLSGAVRSGKLGKQCNAEGMHAYCVKEFGLSHDEAAEHVERFMRDLSMKRSK